VYKPRAATEGRPYSTLGGARYILVRGDESVTRLVKQLKWES